MRTITLSLSMLIITFMIATTIASAQSSWTFQTNPLGSDNNYSMVGKVQFLSSTEGWISAAANKLLHTTNGGATWNVVKCTNDSVFSFADPDFNMQFLNSTTGWVMKTLSTNGIVNFSAAQGAVVYYTTNGGSTWSKSVIASGSGIVGAQLQFIDANNGFATTFNVNNGTGYFYKTTDGGATWTQVNTFAMTDETMRFNFVSTTTGWLLKINDNPAVFKISKTTDGGATWTDQYVDNTSHGIYTMESCGDISFIDANNGWAVGPNSRIFKTTNGGSTWTAVTSSLTSGLNVYQKALFMYDANHIWISVDVPNTSGTATSHFVMHTTDGGTTWTQDNVSLSNAAYSLFFWDTNTGWLTSENLGGVIAGFQPITLSKTINLTTPGSLSTALTSTELNTIENLTITGSIDARDFVTMRDYMPALASLDISGATVANYSGTAGTYPGNVSYPDNEIPQYAFYNYSTSTAKTSLKSIVMPSDVVSIRNEAFMSCTGLTSLTFPTTLQYINDNAFQGCSGLTGTLVLPSSLISLGGGVFQNCTGLSGTLSIPFSLTSLNSWDFAYCTGLTSVSIPSSITAINDNVFNGCSGLTSIYTYASSPVDLSMALNVFAGVNTATCTLYVPSGSKTAYQGANTWQNFTNIVEFTPTAVEHLATSGVKVVVQNQQAIVTGVATGEPVTLYSTLGRVLYNQKATTETVSIPLPAKGIYVVRVGTQNFKVMNH